MAKNKTAPTGASVDQFLTGIDNPRRRADSLTLLALMKQITGLAPEMWGPSIVGFGTYHYRYESGREGDMPLTGFSPRKQSLTVYIMPGFAGYEDLLGRLANTAPASPACTSTNSPTSTGTCSPNSSADRSLT